MSRFNVPDSDVPPPPAWERVVRCPPADLETTRKAQKNAVLGGLRGRDLAYLDRLIVKPWGAEFRVYEDDLADVWYLHIKAGHRTSLHCHPHKRTALLGIAGKATLSTRSGLQYALEPGVVLQIEPGAYHRISASSTGMRLVEVETPKDKLDLVRLEDDTRAPGEPYESEDSAPLGLLEGDVALTAPLALQPFVEQWLDDGRRGRLRAHASADPHRFAVRTGTQVRSSTDLAFAIVLTPRAAALHGPTVLASQRLVAAVPGAAYLTIRSQGARSCRAL
jgi:mannose-6-phosphate isomerase-like protein (cupin superfamily)